MRKDRASHNEYMREYMQARYKRRRNAFIESCGGRCEECGSTEYLEVDHRVASEKKYVIGKAFASLAEAKLQEELKKCRVLCHGCHLIKSREDAKAWHAANR